MNNIGDDVVYSLIALAQSGRLSDRDAGHLTYIVNKVAPAQVSMLVDIGVIAPPKGAPLSVLAGLLSELPDDLTTEAAPDVDALTVLVMATVCEFARSAKPDERSERARRYAILLAELEKLFGYANTYIGGGNEG